MNRGPKVVYVHLGSQLPRWLSLSVEFGQNLCQWDAVVVVDSPKIERLLQDRGLETWLYRDGDEPLPQSLIRSDLDYVKDGFWRKTSTRFWALAAFQADFGHPIVHLENDVIPMVDFPLGRFQDLPTPLAVPLVAPWWGVASIFYSSEPRALREMLRDWSTDRFEREVKNRGPISSDMLRLGLSIDERPELISPLPTIFPGCSAMRHEVQGADLLTLNFSVFDGVFDSASVGQYLFGIDPRNRRGIRMVFTQSKDHVLCPRELDFVLENHSDVYMVDGTTGARCRIFNLHIHSKDLRAFQTSSFVPFLGKRIAMQKGGELPELDVWALSQSARNSWNRLRHSLADRRSHFRGR